MLAGDGSLTEGQLEQIGGVIGALDRLTTLNRTLLLLARIDNRGFPESELVDAGPVLRRIAEDCSEVWSHRELRVEIREKGLFRVEMNDTLAGVLWGNLVKNAFRHSPSGGRISIDISPRGVSVANDDTGGGPLDGELVFRRFWRGAAGEGREEGGAGLGLSLVEAICRIYGLAVSYEYSGGRHIFSIRG
jgi:signal transduction histidine kinase